MRLNANIYKLPLIILFLCAVSWQLNARSFNCARLRYIIIWQICVPLNVEGKYYVQSIVIAIDSFGRICIPLLSKFSGIFCFWNGHALGTSSLWNGHALGHCTQSSRPHIKESIAQTNVEFMSTTSRSRNPVHTDSVTRSYVIHWFGDHYYGGLWLEFQDTNTTGDDDDNNNNRGWHFSGNKSDDPNISIAKYRRNHK